MITAPLLLVALTNLVGPPSPQSGPAHEVRLIADGQLTEAGAERLLALALEEARRRGTTGAFAVVDRTGSLLVFARLDRTFPAASRVALGKAQTAAEFQKPTAVFEELINKGRTSMTALANFTPLAGGVPLLVDGLMVGAIGVSGAASAAEDDELARHAVTGFGSVQPAPACHNQVQHIDGAAVRSAFEKGAVLVGPNACGYEIHASRRTAPGQAEIHADETDLMYVISGTATLVTGGLVSSPKATGPAEVRGTAITEGTERKLAAGDVLVIPAGVPHWFSHVDGAFLYYVVKVKSGMESRS